jgi:hypothetical protein
MKYVIMMAVVVLAVIALGSLCEAADKRGYTVRSVVHVPDDGSIGEAYCAATDYVTGCSYLLYQYPGGTTLADYSFPVVQPIECTEDKEGFRVCTGCRVSMHSAVSETPDATFWVYAYCGRSK